MKTIAFIPVRGGSKSIPGKNIRPLAGRPLLHWTLEAATEAAGVTEVYVSSDSNVILQCARDFGHKKVIVVERAAEFATDTASTEAALLDFAQQHEFDRVVLVQATSPLTRAEDIDGALAHLEKQKADSLLTVTHEHRFRWHLDQKGNVVAVNYDPLKRPRRQDWEGELVENGAFYVTSRRGLLESGCRLSGKVVHWVMSGHTSVEIDTPDDWNVLEALMRTRRHFWTESREIRLLVTDIDGVWTDGGMYFGGEGEALKKFNTRDGMGTAIWRQSGRDLAIVTGENSPSVARRAEKLQIADVHLGVKNKLAVVQRIASERGLSLQQVAYMGDDLNDLEVISTVGLAGCPADGHPRIIEKCAFISGKKGGEGCLRDFIEWILENARDLSPEGSELAARAADS